jgi:hypothetical protein
MKKFISFTLKKGGKQSVLSMNKGEQYNGVGRVTNTHNVNMRIPVSARILQAFEALKGHCLIVSGHWSHDVAKKFDFESVAFDKKAKGAQILHAQKLLQGLSLGYCYYSDGMIVLGGKLKCLGGYESIEVKTPRINLDSEYEFFELLEEACEELSSAVMDWYDNRKNVDKKQMAMSFVEIDEQVTKEEAEKVFEAMSEEERDEIINKHMLKFIEAKEEMYGDEKEEEEIEESSGEVVESRTKVSEKEDDKGSDGGSGKDVDGVSGVDKQNVSASRRNGAKKANNDMARKEKAKVEIEEDPFGEEEEEALIPKV